jgi:hypothetical protein
MDFSPASILLTIFTGIVAGFASYFGSYSKVKGEVRAATEDLRQTIQNLTETTRAIELEKAQIAASASLASDHRKAVYALAIATQAFVHSMCWLSWDAKIRGTVRAEMTKQYDTEAHRLLPEIFGQLALLRLLDQDLHSRAYPYAWNLASLDVEFGLAIVLAERDEAAGVEKFRSLFTQSTTLQNEIDQLFGGTASFARATIALSR